MLLSNCSFSIFLICCLIAGSCNCRISKQSIKCAPFRSLSEAPTTCPAWKPRCFGLDANGWLVHVRSAAEQTANLESIFIQCITGKSRSGIAPTIIAFRTTEAASSKQQVANSKWQVVVAVVVVAVVAVVATIAVIAVVATILSVEVVVAVVVVVR